MSFTSSKKCFFIATILYFFFLVAHVNAATGIPTTFSYQGRLTDASGNLLGSSSGTNYYFKFSIWNVATGGTAGTNRLWPSSAPSSATISVRQGVFNADIDTAGYNFNISSDVFLQVEVSSDNINFETLDPRQRISAAPFAQVSGSVSGVGQSSIGTTTPFNNSLLSIESTSTQSIGLSIRGIIGQIANLFQIQDSTGVNLFVVDNTGKVGVGVTTPSRKFDVLDTASAAQLRLGQSASAYGEFQADSAGDIRISSTGGNVRQNNENLWVCSGGGCGVDTPTSKGNIIVENGVIFDNKFKLKQIDASTTVMYDTTDNPIFEFDEGQ
jgi:hypothetical protein